MTDKIRLIIAASQRDMISAINDGLKHKPFIESIYTVSHPTEAEGKLNKNGTNVLIWDIDEFHTNHVWSKSMQGKCTFYVLYSSLNSSKYNLLPSSGNDVFLQKPAVFTPMTTSRFISVLTDNLTTMSKRQAAPNMRELNKMITVNDKQKIIAIGSSTGGTNALEDLLKKLPPIIPPMVVVQHMPSGFTKLFADRLNALYPQEIREAQSGDFLMRGRMLVAPADRHMRLVTQQGKLAVECYVGNRIHGVMPAADILFESVAALIGGQGIGVILTGMGSDGAKGLMKMKTAGCTNIGQNEATCVVYGMPKAAKDIGAITKELPLGQIPDEIMRLAGPG
ncbi:MAG: chemotaxis protein CheB [Clostridiales bacterium]|jgi:two-component system chemotaxis response regulator CheB|nr:chemotaxis protein CheB [Clostridiales bacterium]